MRDGRHGADGRLLQSFFPSSRRGQGGVAGTIHPYRGIIRYIKACGFTTTWLFQFFCSVRGAKPKSLRSSEMADGVFSNPFPI